MNRVVFDTNVLIAAIISDTGSPFKCLDMAKRKLIESITCAEILAELRSKLIDKLDYPPEFADARVEDIREFSRLVAITGALKVVEADPKDDKIIECAVVGKATHLVTGDRRHLLPLKEYQGIAILTPVDFLSATPKE